ncbi:hypothetical protein FHU38_001703 [Saccharomonospora amisosensis]|uniref:Pyridoxamine 5'-phosphate oxidase n=1 Tax=Saccharomonospora amisosensis TaxID=1128677 RepID=A0A7X5UNP2_9PSEU|nr:hypothetical protein [Saccharomonospora amisosensis]NIJ11359.1 hypothetical protein [Saccharomonospora amisosensis]
MDSPTLSEQPLSHQQCLGVITRPRCGRMVVVTITGAPPLALLCVVSTGGDIIVPTGTDPRLERLAHDKPVTVEFPDEAGCTITGVGLACPLRHEDRVLARATLPRGHTFDHGIRVLIARLTGSRVVQR